MNRIVNAVLIGMATFVVFAALIWVVLGAPGAERALPAGNDDEPTTTTTTSSTTSPTKTTTTSPTTSTTTAPTTTTTKPTTTSTPTATTTSTSTYTTTQDGTTTTTSAPTTTSTIPLETTTTTVTTEPDGNTTTTNTSAAGASAAGPGVPPEVTIAQFQDPSDDLERGALRFIIGGLMLLSLVFVLAVLGGFIPYHPKRKGAAAGFRRILGTPTLDEAPTRQRVELPVEARQDGQARGASHRPKTLAELLQTVDEELHGEPRLLRFHERGFLIRFYHCPDCETQRTGSAGCAHVAGFLEGVAARFQKAPWRADELACRRQGSSVCEFEVRR